MTSPRDPSPNKGDEVVTDSANSPLIVFDGPGDTTRRPLPPGFPRYFPGRKPPEGYPRPKSPPDPQPPPPDDP